MIWRAPFSFPGATVWICALTTIFETCTLALRFGAKLESTRDTAPYLSWLTMGYRVHHSYIGLLVVLAAAVSAWGFRQPRRRAAFFCLILGASLIFSDLIHHFAILWPITKSPEFHLVYPQE